MALQITTNINVDFYDKKYIMINAKQYDDCSRFISITCYDNGKLFNLNSSKHTVYIRYRKADECVVLNSCRVNTRGEVLVELTEQMLSADGICYVDLIIVNKGSAIVNIDTGEIVTIDNSPIISTMAFCINVYEAAYDSSVIESSDEYIALNDALKMANAEYKEVIQLAKSYAIGNAGGIREGEDTDNAKYYYEQSIISADNAKTSETNAAISEEKALASETNAKESEEKASISEANAKASEDKALVSETNAKTSETNASTSEQNAKISEINSASSEANAKISETNAASSELNAKASEDNAASSADLSKSYAIGGTGLRENESIDNAYYYYDQAKRIVTGLNGVILPMGTIAFEELSSMTKQAGYMYNISNDFVSTSDFKDGGNYEYPAGTNVYYTADGYWDCLAGVSFSTATVDEVKNYLSI